MIEVTVIAALFALGWTIEFTPIRYFLNRIPHEWHDNFTWKPLPAVKYIIYKLCNCVSCIAWWAALGIGIYKGLPLPEILLAMVSAYTLATIIYVNWSK